MAQPLADLNQYLLDQLARCDTFHDMCQGSRDKKNAKANLEDIDIQVNGLVKKALDEVPRLNYNNLKNTFDTIIDNNTLTFDEGTKKKIKELFDDINCKKTKSLNLQISGVLSSTKLNISDNITILEISSTNITSVDAILVEQSYTITKIKKHDEGFNVKLQLSGGREIHKQLFHKDYNFYVLGGWKKGGTVGWDHKLYLEPFDTVISLLRQNVPLFYIDSNSNVKPVPTTKKVYSRQNDKSINIEIGQLQLKSSDFNKICVYGWSSDPIFADIGASFSTEMSNIYLLIGSEISYCNNTLKKSIIITSLLPMLKRYQYSNELTQYSWYISKFDIQEKSGAQSFKDLVQGDFITAVYTNPDVSLHVGYIYKLSDIEFDIYDGTMYYIATIVFEDGEVKEAKLYEDSFEKFKEFGWSYCTESSFKKLESSFQTCEMKRQFDKLKKIINAKTNEYKDHIQYIDSYKTTFPWCKLHETKINEGTIDFKINTTINTTINTLTLNYNSLSLSAKMPYIDKKTLIAKRNETITNDTYGSLVSSRSKETRNYKEYRRLNQSINISYIEKNFPNVVVAYEKTVSFNTTDYRSSDSTSYTIKMGMYGVNDVNGWVFQGESFKTSTGRIYASQYNDKVIQFVHKMNPSISGDPDKCKITNLTENYTQYNTRLLQVLVPKLSSDDDDDIGKEFVKCVKDFFSPHTQTSLKLLCETKVDLIENNFDQSELVCSITQMWDSSATNKCATLNDTDSFPAANEKPYSDQIMFYYKLDNTTNVIEYIESQVQLSYKNCKYLTIDGKGDKNYKNPKDDENYIIKTVDLLRKCIVGLETKNKLIPNPGGTTNCSAGKYTKHEDINYALDIKRSGDAFMIIRAMTLGAIYVTSDQLAFLHAKLRGLKCILVANNARTYNFLLYNPDKHPAKPQTSIVSKPKTITKRKLDVLTKKIDKDGDEEMIDSTQPSLSQPVKKHKTWIEFFTSKIPGWIPKSFQGGGTPEFPTDDIEYTEEQIQAIYDCVMRYLFESDKDAQCLIIVDFILDNILLFQNIETSKCEYKRLDPGTSQTNLVFIDDQLWEKFDILFNYYSKLDNLDQLEVDKTKPWSDELTDSTDYKYILTVLFFTRPETIAKYIKNHFDNWDNFKKYAKSLIIQDTDTINTDQRLVKRSALGDVPMIWSSKPQPSLGKHSAGFSKSKIRNLLFLRMLKKKKQIKIKLKQSISQTQQRP